MSWARVWPLMAGLAVGCLVVTGCGSATSSGTASAGVGTTSPTATPTPPTTPPSTSATTVPDPQPSDPLPPPGKVPTRTAVTLTGTPRPGVESGCLVLDAYVLVGGDRALLASGKKLNVSGHTQPDLASYCQQGTLLVVDAATPAG